MNSSGLILILIGLLILYAGLTGKLACFVQCAQCLAGTQSHPDKTTEAQGFNSLPDWFGTIWN